MIAPSTSWRRLATLVTLPALPLLACLLLAPGCQGGSEQREAPRPLSARLLVPKRASRGVPIIVGLLEGEGEGQGQGTVEERCGGPALFRFGDGEEAESPSCFTSHTYKQAGVYTVSAQYTATGGAGQTERSRTIEVLDTPGPEARFTIPGHGEAPSFGDLPFPSEFYRQPDGTISIADLPVRNEALRRALEKGLASVDGFGTNAALFLWFSGPIDPDVLPRDPWAFAEPGSPVLLVDIDPSSASYTKRVPLAASWDGEEKRLSVMPYPGFPLEEHTSYALVVTPFLVGPSGTVTASGDFAALSEDDPVVSGRTPERVRRLYAYLWDALEAQSDIPSPRTLPCATVFTTQSVTHRLLPVQQALDTGKEAGIPDPRPEFDEHYIFGEGFPRSLDMLIGEQPLSGPGYDPPSHDQLAAVVTKAFYLSPDYLSADEDLFDPEGGQFVLEDGVPLLQGTRRIPFTLTLPRTPAPAGGYPVVIVGHGLGLARWYEPIIQANELARHGFAVAAIDAAMHGDRYDVTNIHPLVALLLHRLLPSLGMEFPLAPEDRIINYTGGAGADGFADPNHDGAQLAFIKGFANLAGIRDNVLQTVVDLMQLARVFRNGPVEIPGLGQIRFQADRVLYLGNSLGAWIGAILVSVDPLVQAAALNCGGGGIIVNLIVNSPAFGGEFGPVLAGLFGLSEKDLSSPFSPILNLVQTVVEAMDPLNWAPRSVVRPFEYPGARPQPAKHLLLEEVMWDNSMPNEATEALARAFGASLLEPCYRDVGFVPRGGTSVSANAANGRSTVALAQYAPAEHGFNIGWRQGHIYYQLGFPFEEPPRFRPVVDAQGRATQHPIRNPVEPGVAQLIEFFETFLRQGLPRVEMKYGYAPVHDYDDDGCLDEEETLAGSDPSNPASRPFHCGQTSGQSR